jgi:hypothetical protein
MGKHFLLRTASGLEFFIFYNLWQITGISSSSTALKLDHHWIATGRTSYVSVHRIQLTDARHYRGI